MKINYTIKDWALIGLTIFCLLLVFLKKAPADRPFDNIANLEAENENLKRSLEASGVALSVVSAEAAGARKRDSSLIIWYEALLLADYKKLEAAKQSKNEKISRISNFGADSLRRAFASL